MIRRRPDKDAPEPTLAVSQAELARRSRRSRSTICGLMKGVLRDAALKGGRVDLGHPALVAFARDVWGLSRAELLRGTAGAHAALPKLGLDQRTTTLEALAEESGEHIDDVRLALAGAVIPLGHISVEEFAARAEIELAEVVAACEDELAAAVTPTGRLDLGHAAALAFLAARPFERRRGDPVVPLIAGDGYLVPAMVGDQFDLEHPVARAFLARCRGRVEEVA